MKRIRDIAPMATGVRDLETAKKAIAQLEDRWRDVVNHDHDGQGATAPSGARTGSGSGSGSSSFADIADDVDALTLLLMGA